MFENHEKTVLFVILKVPMQVEFFEPLEKYENYTVTLSKFFCQFN